MYKLTAIFIIIISISFGQTGGQNAFPFLDLSYNAKSSALSRYYISQKDNDVNQAINNPALWNNEMHNNLGLNQALLAGGINHGMVAYARNINEQTTGGVHARYLTYGKMDRTNANGETIGTFSAGDLMIGAGFSQEFAPGMSAGANLSFIWSQLESYNAFGVALDLGGHYVTSDEQTSVSIVVRNAGFQFSNYLTDNERVPLPVNPMIGVAHKLKHAPFRIGVVAHHLNRWDLSYFDPNAPIEKDPLSGEDIINERAGFLENLGRHFIVQIEVVPSKVFNLRLAFDYQRRREMLVPNRPGMGGFSTGVGFNFEKFSIDYGLVVYSSAGFHNLLSLTTNFDKWK